MDWRSREQYGRCPSARFEPRFKVLGKTELLSAGSRVAAGPLDHVIAFNERHLKRLLSDYVRYYQEDRTHLGLRKGTPGGHSSGRRDLGTVVSQALPGRLAPSLRPSCLINKRKISARGDSILTGAAEPGVVIGNQLCTPTG